MSAKTSIEWCDKTWGPVRGCSRVSAGCDRCYAMRQAHRFDFPGGAYEGLTRIGKRGVDWSGKVRLIPEALDEPLRWRKPQRVFVNSMSDLFHESLPDEAISSVFGVMGTAERHTFQILTKRPARMLDYIAKQQACWKRLGPYSGRPLENVWLGVSVEDQATADERIPPLLQTPAAVRFVSYEPALGPVDFTCIEWHRDNGSDYFDALTKARPALDDIGLDGAALDWLIVGGESGPGARDFYLAWARSAIAQCKAAGVPVFTKQVGARPIERCPECYGSGASIPANTSGTCPECRGDGIVTLRLRDRKGGSMEEWPEDLRIREFPKGATA